MSEQPTRSVLADERLADLITVIVRRELAARVAEITALIEGARPSSAEATLNAKGEVQLSAKEYDTDSLTAMGKVVDALIAGIEKVDQTSYPSTARKARG